MEIDSHTLKCKSLPSFWVKEQSYIKRNTVRSLESLRHDGYELSDLSLCKWVQILNTETQKSFKRKISDISTWGKWVIISW